MVVADVVAVVPAAGASRRAGGGSKLFRVLGGVPVVVRTLRQLSAVPAIAAIVLVARRSDLQPLRRLVQRYRLCKVTQIIRGGPTRMASVQRGLRAVDGSARYVAIHDAARPLVTPAAVARVIRAARRTGAAILAVPATDTVKLVGRRVTTLPRTRLWLAQTPQVFARPLITRAYAAATRARVTVTDDAAAVERLRRPVTLVPGTMTNLKLTWPVDFVVAERLLRNGVR